MGGGEGGAGGQAAAGQADAGEAEPRAAQAAHQEGALRGAPPVSVPTAQPTQIELYVMR